MARTTAALAAVLPIAVAVLAAGPARAISVAGFGPGGEAGAARGLPIAFGAGGEVFDLAARLAVGGAVSAPADPLPAGLAFSFSAALSADASDLTLTYAFANTGAAPVADLSFLSYVDAEIDEPLNTFFDEFASVDGAPAPGQGFEVDEPGFASGDLLAHVTSGVLDGSNALPAGSPDDVAMALSFTVASLAPGEVASIRILLSEDGDRLGSLALVQRDVDPRSAGTVLSYSGATGVAAAPPAAIPEPTGALLFALGASLVAGRGRALVRC